jgi:phage tail sheath protein FI
VPEYLAPGVYVEETSFRPKTIEGVSTSTAGFVGPARFGPTSGEPRLLTNFADFQRIYGGLEDLEFENRDESRTNYLAYAVRAFFEEGGRRCYVARVYQDKSEGDEGYASGSSENGSLTFNARYPGKAGNMKVTVAVVSSRSVNPVTSSSSDTSLPQLSRGDTVFVPGGGNAAKGFYDYTVEKDAEKLLPAGYDPDSNSSSVEQVTSLDGSDTLYPMRVRVSLQRPIPSAGSEADYTSPETIGEFTLSPESSQWLVEALAADNPTRDPLVTPLEVEPLSNAETGADYAKDLFGSQTGGGGSSSIDSLDDFGPVSFFLGGGNDGDEPVSYTTEEPGPLPPNDPEGFDALEDLENVSIVAAPGYTAIGGSDDDVKKTNRLSLQSQLIGHCEEMKYRIAVLDTPPKSTVKDARDWRGNIDSKYAAMYHPWITIFDPLTRSELNVPPSGHVAGLYARNDAEDGVHKAPANMVVRSAVGFEKRINKRQQDVLNPESVNCFRFFEGRGNRLWGARMATSDNEYKYVNIRRYLAYLERSIDEGTQVFVFENNGADLWRNVRRTIGSFLKNEWRSDRLMGTTPEQAYFVKCDRSTMTQNDIDNGRLICEIGVALFRPAEFVIFRIGQKLLSDTG